MLLIFFCQIVEKIGHCFNFVKEMCFRRKDIMFWPGLALEGLLPENEVYTRLSKIWVPTMTFPWWPLVPWWPQSIVGTELDQTGTWSHLFPGTRGQHNISPFMRGCTGIWYGNTAFQFSMLTCWHLWFMKLWSWRLDATINPKVTKPRTLTAFRQNGHRRGEEESTAEIMALSLSRYIRCYQGKQRGTNIIRRYIGKQKLSLDKS